MLCADKLFAGSTPYNIRNYIRVHLRRSDTGLRSRKLLADVGGIGLCCRYHDTDRML